MPKQSYPKTDRVRELREAKYDRDQAAMKAAAEKSAPKPAPRNAKGRRAK
jgi:hypothetical protein